MWTKAILIGILIGVLFVAFSLVAQPNVGGQKEVIDRLDKIIVNQTEMLKYLKFIKNRV